MARRTPPRYKSGPKKGQFMPKRARKRKARKNPGRTVARRRNPPKRRKATTRRTVRRKAPAKRRTYRRNPRRIGIVRTLIDGTVEAGQILVGKAAVRTIPDLAGLPKQGNMGLAVQAGTALVIGIAADMFLSKAASRALVAGALTAPLETLIISFRTPWLALALSPVTANNALGAYVRASGLPAGAGAGMGRYVKAPSVSRLSTARGMGNGSY